MSSVKTVSWKEWAEWVNKQLDGHQTRLKRHEEQLGKIANKVRPLHEAHLEPKVLELLRKDGHPRTWRWIFNRLGHDAWDPLKKLVAKGQVTTVRSGHIFMYVATEG